MLYIPIIRLVVENIQELEATAKSSADSPDLSPIDTNSNFKRFLNKIFRPIKKPLVR